MENFTITTTERQFTPFLNEKEQTWTEPFYFIQAADTQFGMQEKYVEKKQEYGWSQEIEWTSQMIEEVNSMSPKPKFMVICGDLLDAWPETEEEIRNQQEQDFKRLFSQLDIPLVCVCGNHDIGNSPTYRSVDKYRSSFGDDFFSFWCGGVFFIVLNTQYYEDSSQVPTLLEEHEVWLEQQLDIVRRENPQHAVVFQHIPFFLEHPDEEKEYFNFDIRQRQYMLDRLHDAGVRYVFSGHYHRNAGGFYKDLEEVVTSAIGAQLGEEQQGYRIVKVLEDELQHQYYPLGTAPTVIDLPYIPSDSIEHNNTFSEPSRPMLPWSNTSSHNEDSEDELTKTADTKNLLLMLSDLKFSLNSIESRQQSQNELEFQNNYLTDNFFVFYLFALLYLIKNMDNFGLLAETISLEEMQILMSFSYSYSFMFRSNVKN